MTKSKDEIGAAADKICNQLVGGIDEVIKATGEIINGNRELKCVEKIPLWYVDELKPQYFQLLTGYFYINDDEYMKATNNRQNLNGESLKDVYLYAAQKGQLNPVLDVDGNPLSLYTIGVSIVINRYIKDAELLNAVIDEWDEMEQ